MSTQLRLIKTAATGDGTDRTASTPKRVRGRTVKNARGRRVHWESEWRLDARHRQVGRQGVAAARAALRHAHRPDDQESLAS